MLNTVWKTVNKCKDFVKIDVNKWKDLTTVSSKTPKVSLH